MSTELTPQMQVVRWEQGACVLLDQTKIPNKEVYLTCRTHSEVVLAIQSLSVRGAPAIGIAGAYACVLAMQRAFTENKTASFLEDAFNEVRNARPTAVNLNWAVGRMQRKWLSGAPISLELIELFLSEAKEIHREDIECNQRISRFGAAELPEKGAVLTCCNTGDLATGGVGTAFGVIREGYAQGKITHVYVCETRPVLQGLRLTTFELQKNGIPYTVICDNMAATLMQQKKVQSVITGADRIAKNGDSANKIGTYSLAVLANFHKIPFFVAAPFSTFDLTIESGADIPIENRDPEEVLSILGTNLPDYKISVFNPAFDVAPHSLITAVISDKGSIRPPNKESVHRVISKSML